MENLTRQDLEQMSYEEQRKTYLAIHEACFLSPGYWKDPKLKKEYVRIGLALQKPLGLESIDFKNFFSK
jgi:hypothetical protein